MKLLFSVSFSHLTVSKASFCISRSFGCSLAYWFHGCFSEVPNIRYMIQPAIELAAAMRKTKRHCSTVCYNNKLIIMIKMISRRINDRGRSDSLKLNLHYYSSVCQRSPVRWNRPIWWSSRRIPEEYWRNSDWGQRSSPKRKRKRRRWSPCRSSWRKPRAADGIRWIPGL